MSVVLGLSFIVIFLGLYLILKKANLSHKFILTFLVPVICVTTLLYTQFGGWRLLKSQASYEVMLQTLNELYNEPNLTPDYVRLRLAQLTKDLPEHPFLWYRLGEIYEKLGWHQESKQSFQEALRLSPDSVETQIKFVYASSLSQGGLLDDETNLIVQKLLRANEQNLPALNLIAMDAYQRGQYEQAVKTWQQMLLWVKQNNMGGYETEAIERALHQAASHLGDKKLETKIPNIGITVTVDLDVPNLEQLNLDTPVFVFARIKDRPGPPVAVTKLTLRELPIQVTLTKDHAMQPSHSIDIEQDIIVTARIALSGQPVAMTGDWQGQSSVIHVTGLHEVDVLINEKV